MTSPEPLPPQYLAAGFRSVDTSGNTPAYTACLDLLSDVPFFREVKQESFRIIAGTYPSRVLDAGCGAGTDLVALAGLLPPSSQITGLDASAALLATASGRTAEIRDRCHLVRGDLVHIPCRDEMFPAVRIDRVLQHIHNPACVIRELARVTAPGGTLVAFDNDWETFSVSLDDHETAARITRFWRDSFASGRAGADLARHFQKVGLGSIHVVPRTLMLGSLSVAEKVFEIPTLIGRMAGAGIFSEQETAAIREELAHRDAAGTFACGYTGYLVRGTKPE